MMECMSEVTAQINLEKLVPKEKADFVLSKDIYVNSLNQIGDLVPLKQCRVKNIDHITPSNKAVLFSLSIEVPDSTLLFLFQLVKVINRFTLQSLLLAIQCNPSTSGIHTIKVQVYYVATT